VCLGRLNLSIKAFSSAQHDTASHLALAPVSLQNQSVALQAGLHTLLSTVNLRVSLAPSSYSVDSCVLQQSAAELDFAMRISAAATGPSAIAEILVNISAPADGGGVLTLGELLVPSCPAPA